MGLFNLGNLYKKGLGVERDEVKAFNLFERASQLDNGHATMAVAEAYEKALGTKKDLEMACTSYLKCDAIEALEKLKKLLKLKGEVKWQTAYHKFWPVNDNEKVMLILLISKWRNRSKFLHARHLVKLVALKIVQFFCESLRDEFFETD